MTENKRFIQDGDTHIIDTKTYEEFYAPCEHKLRKLLNEFNEENEDLKQENEELKQSVNNLKDTIIKITIAYQRKYDKTIVDLVHGVHDEDITDLIKELKE